MAAHVKTVVVSESDRQVLQRRARAKGAPARDVERARIVLLAADGQANTAIAARVRGLAADGDHLAQPVRRTGHRGAG